MATVLIKYDYKDGCLAPGQQLMNTDKIKILGRNLIQIIEVVNREDRADGLNGGSIEMLIVNYGNSEYGIIDMTLSQFETCLSCPPGDEGCTGICIDGCNLYLEDCCVTLN